MNYILANGCNCWPGHAYGGYNYVPNNVSAQRACCVKPFRNAAGFVAAVAIYLINCIIIMVQSQDYCTQEIINYTCPCRCRLMIMPIGVLLSSRIYVVGYWWVCQMHVDMRRYIQRLTLVHTSHMQWWCTSIAMDRLFRMKCMWNRLIPNPDRNRCP